MDIDLILKVFKVWVKWLIDRYLIIDSCEWIFDCNVWKFVYVIYIYFLSNILSNKKKLVIGVI